MNDNAMTKDSESSEGYGCINPSNMTVEQVECECWADVRKECHDFVGEEQVRCFRDALCTNAAIMGRFANLVCPSWQMEHCTEEERLGLSFKRGLMDVSNTFNKADQDTSSFNGSEAGLIQRRQAGTHQMDEGNVDESMERKGCRRRKA